MKVLHIFEYSRPNISGYSSRSDAIIQNQRAVGIETCQMTSQRYDLFDNIIEEADGVSYYRTAHLKSFLSKIPLLSYLPYISHLCDRIEEIVKIEKPDVIHAHSPMLNGIAALRVAKKLNIPVVYEIRAFWEDAAVDTGKTKEGSLRYRLIRALEQYVITRVDKVSCICKGLHDEVIKRGVNAKNVFMSPNCADLTKFTPISIKDETLEVELKLKNKKVLAFLGSFFKYEGLEFAIKALPLIEKSIPNIHLLLVGDGNEKENLLALSKQLGVKHLVTFVGRVNFDKINQYYSLADALVFPRESIKLTHLVTPLKPLECMAQQLPVIASNVGGHKELIEDGKTGLLFEAENIESLAAKVILLIGDNELQEKLKVNGLAYVTNVRNWLNTAKKYHEIYSELLKNKSSI